VREPPISIQIFSCTEKSQKRMVVTSPRALGNVSLTLLDHHGDPLTTALTRALVAGSEIFAFELPSTLFERGVEGVHLYVHDLASSGSGHGRFDFTAGPGVYLSQASRPERQLANGSFWLGGLAAPVR
jgi:hypothetical protein